MSVRSATPAWLEDWSPVTEVQELVVDGAPLAALTALFADGLPAPAAGDPLPPLWHLAALPRWAPAPSVGPDGHVRRGAGLPPVPLARRMHAGSTVEQSGPLLVGDRVRLHTRVRDVEAKTGRSGELVVVTIAREVLTEQGTALTEAMQLVYRDPGPAMTEQVVLEQAPAGLVREQAWAWTLATDPVLLMRFSAATANTHRIHYDAPYATGVEGYPALVVQGPLLALGLAELVRLEAPDRPVTQFRFRAQRPAFCGQRVRFRGQPDPSDGGRLTLTAETVNGVCMTAEAWLA